MCSALVIFMIFGGGRILPLDYGPYFYQMANRVKTRILVQKEMSGKTKKLHRITAMFSITTN